MKRWLRNVAGGLRARRRSGTAPRRGDRLRGYRAIHLSVLALEDLLVPAVTAPTDMTDLARLFPRHTGPTTLYLNFDGWRHADPAQPEITGIAPFMAVSGDRDKDI